MKRGAKIMKISITITKADGTYQIETDDFATYCTDIPSTVQAISSLVARELFYACGDEWNETLQKHCLGTLEMIERRL